MELSSVSTMRYTKKETNGISMGSPNGPIIAHTFVGFHENQLIKEFSPFYYKRYMDDIFAIFSKDCQKDPFLEKLNNMHVNLNFIIENSADSKLAFLDVLVHREKNNIFIPGSTEKQHSLGTTSRLTLSVRSNKK